MPNFFINVKETGAKKAEKNVKGLTKSLGGLKSQAMLAAGAFLGTGALIAGIKGAVNAFGEQELAEKKLEASLGRTSQALLDQAAALQQVSNFGDETIISAQALIAAFVDDEEQIKLATQATLDLAAAKGMDLNAAADLVSKTLGSSTNAMSRYGIQVTGAVGSTERLESLTNNLANVFGGQATAQAQTMAGAMRQAKMAIGDAAEALGDIVGPLVTAGAAMTKDFANQAEAAFDSLSKIDFSATFENMKTNIGALQTLIIESFKLAFSAIPDLFGFFMNKIVPLSLKALGALWEGIKSVSAFLWEPIGIGIQIVIAKVKNFFIGMVNFAKDQFNSLAQIANKLGADIQPMEMSKLIDTEGLSMANSQMVGLLTQGSEDNLNTFGDFQKAQLQLYKDYANSIIVQNEEIEKSDKKKTDAGKKGAKGQEAATKAVSKVTLESGIAAGASADSVIGAVRQVIKAKFSEMIAGLLAKELGSKGLAGVVTGAAGAALAMQLFEKVVPKVAATGMNEIVSQPTMILAGEAGAESVNITPLNPVMNQNGGGGSVNVSISGNVMSQDFVEGELAEQIKEAVRRGVSFA